MKPGDLVKSISAGELDLYEGIRDDEQSFANGHSLFPSEFGLILETYHGIGNHVYYRILTPQGATGWINELQVSIQ